MHPRALLTPARAVLLLLVALASLGSALPHDVRMALTWQLAQRDAPITWLSAHFVHLGLAHLLPDLLALLALFLIAERLALAPDFLFALLTSALAVDVGLVSQYWPVDWYCGLSGALHGGFAFLCLRFPRQRGMPMAWAGLLWAAGLLKVIVEVSQPAGTPGGLLATWAPFPLAPPAHCYGYVGGSAWAIVCIALRRKRA